MKIVINLDRIIDTVLGVVVWIYQSVSGIWDALLVTEFDLFFHLGVDLGFRIWMLSSHFSFDQVKKICVRFVIVIECLQWLAEDVFFAANWEVYVAVLTDGDFGGFLVFVQMTYIKCVDHKVKRHLVVCRFWGRKLKGGARGVFVMAAWVKGPLEVHLIDRSCEGAVLGFR